MVEVCIVPVGFEDSEGIIDVCDTVGLSVEFVEVLLVLNEIAEVGLVATPETVTVLVSDSVGLYAVVWTVISEVSLDRTVEE